MVFAALPGGGECFTLYAVLLAGVHHFEADLAQSRLDRGLAAVSLCGSMSLDAGARRYLHYGSDGAYVVPPTRGW